MKRLFSTDDRSRDDRRASRVAARREPPRATTVSTSATTRTAGTSPDSQHSVLVLGPPRSGKTSALLIPNVLSAPGAVVTTSTKPDVLDATARRPARRSARAISSTPRARWPTAPGVHRLRWSPLPGCASWRTALMTARVARRRRLHGARCRAGRGVPLDRARPGAARTPAARRRPRGCRHAHRAGWVDRRRALPAQQALDPAGDAAIARDLLDGIVTTDERELSGIWSTASGALGRLPVRARRWPPPCDPDFDPRHLRAPRATPCTSPPRRTTRRSSLRSWWACSTTSAVPPTTAPPTDGGRSGPPVVLALDELANIAPLPELPSMVSEGGGQGLVTLACFQDLSQARHRWPGQADGFPSLFGTTVVLPGIGDVRTLEALSVLSGDHELVVRSVSRGRAAVGPSRSTDLLARGRIQTGEQLVTQWRRRLAPDEITRGRPGHALAFGAAQPAAVVPARPGPRRRAVAKPPHTRALPRRSPAREARTAPRHSGGLGPLTGRARSSELDPRWVPLVGPVPEGATHPTPGVTCPRRPFRRLRAGVERPLDGGRHPFGGPRSVVVPSGAQGGLDRTGQAFHLGAVQALWCRVGDSCHVVAARRRARASPPTGRVPRRRRGHGSSHPGPTEAPDRPPERGR